MLGAMLLAGASLSGGSSAETDFGIRVVGPPEAPARGASSAVRAVTSGTLSLSGAASLGARWGRVTSTYRSPEHNRRVGGVRTSFHLSGRAVDIARRPGVSHAAIAAAYRDAGYQLVESLDEGDHSHFAFSFGASAVRSPSLRPIVREGDAATQWRIVFAPSR